MNKPYLTEIVTEIVRKYNPNYGDNRVCECGHEYYRHFDSYENMYPCGCKYCECFTFVEANSNTSETQLVYHMIREEHIPLRQWMRWCPTILVPKLTEEEWQKLPKY